MSIFSEELIKKIKECYPDERNYKRLIEISKSKPKMLVRYLGDRSHHSYIKNEDIINANTLEELKEKALLYNKRKELYNKSSLEYSNHINYIKSKQS